ncbi:hypothetical protein FOXYSP1_17346 [Fusarium oxysporum f. sp. phaseoli]
MGRASPTITVGLATGREVPFGGMSREKARACIRLRRKRPCRCAPVGDFSGPTAPRTKNTHTYIHTNITGQSQWVW